MNLLRLVLQHLLGARHDLRESNRVNSFAVFPVAITDTGNTTAAIHTRNMNSRHMVWFPRRQPQARNLTLMGPIHVSRCISWRRYGCPHQKSFPPSYLRIVHMRGYAGQDLTYAEDKRIDLVYALIQRQPWRSMQDTLWRAIHTLHSQISCSGQGMANGNSTIHRYM